MLDIDRSIERSEAIAAGVAARIAELEARRVDATHAKRTLALVQATLLTMRKSRALALDAMARAEASKGADGVENCRQTCGRASMSAAGAAGMAALYLGGPGALALA
jgi:hypothetical protein